MGATVAFCLAVGVGIAATLAMAVLFAREFATGRTEPTVGSLAIAAVSLMPLVTLSVVGLIRVASLF